MNRRFSVGQVLLGIVAAGLIVGTVLALGVGLDWFVAPPNLADTLDLPGRIAASQPYRDAIWPYDFASHLAFVLAFGALALASDSIAALGRPGQGTGVLRVAVLTSGILGVAAGLLYVGANGAANTGYCDCGFKVEETIAQLWALNIFEGGATWLEYGAIVVGALAVLAASIQIPFARSAPTFRGLAWTSAILLIAGVVMTEVVDSQFGQLVTALATGIALPIWVALLGMRLRPDENAPSS